MFAIMRTLRTPDERFQNLPEFPYAPNYCEVSDDDGGVLRIAWVQEGPDTADPVLLLHGEPSWSYLYRKMIPILVAAGHRVVCPDLVGFGRSDKPTNREDHSYARHVEWMRALSFDVLDLHDVTLVGQDWGGLIGLRLAAEHPTERGHHDGAQPEYRLVRARRLSPADERRGARRLRRAIPGRRVLRRAARHARLGADFAG